MSFLRNNIPAVFAPEAIAPAGKRVYELSPYTLALVDRETNLTIDALTYSSDKRYEIVLTHGHKGQNNSQFPDLTGSKLPTRLPVTKVTKTHLFDSPKDPKPFVAYLGNDGISNCKTLDFECGKTYGMNIMVRGQMVRDSLNRNYSELATFSTGCCDDCNFNEKGEAVADAILDSLEQNTFYIQNYFTAEKIKNCCPKEPPFEKKPYKEWTLTLCNNGTTKDLAKIQRFYENAEIVELKREAPHTTYLVCVPCPFREDDQIAIDLAQAALDALPEGDPGIPVAEQALADAIALAEANALIDCKPTDYVQKNTAPLVCGECPDCPQGFTKVEGGEKLTACVFSPLLVDPAEAFEVDYYNDPVAAEAAINALIEPITDVIPGFIGNVAVLGTTCDDITLSVCVAEGTNIKEHGIAGLTLSKIGECKPSCEGENSTPWCEGCDKYKVSRTVCLTLKKDDCVEGETVDTEHPMFVDVKTALEQDDSVLIDTLAVRKDADCMVSFVVDQCNNECLEDGCDTYGKDGAKFDDVTPYKGFLWQMCDCPNWTLDEEGCPIPIDEDLVDTCLWGIKFTGALVDPETGEPCIYDIHDHIDREPITIEMSIVEQYRTQNGGMNCDIPKIDWTVVQLGEQGDGYGQFALKEEVLSGYYRRFKYFNPKKGDGALWQKALGYEYGIDPSKKYMHLDIYYNESNPVIYNDNVASRRHVLKLYVEEGNNAFLEELKTFWNKTLLKGTSKLL